MKYIKSLLIITVIFISGCATMPDVKLGYYLSKVELDVTVTQSATCSKNNVPILNNQINVVPKYSRDLEAYQQIDLNKLDNAFTNSEFNVTMYEDGRLKSINSTQTGQGQEVINSIVTLLGASPAAIVAMAPKIKVNDCDHLRQFLTKEGDVLTIKHTAMVDFNTPGPIQLKRQNLSEEAFSKVKSIFGDNISLDYSIVRPSALCINKTEENQAMPCTETDFPEKQVKVKLRQPAIAEFVAKAGPSSNITKLEFSTSVPQQGETYVLPIQRPPVFGTNKFELSLSESGTITNLKYGKDSGSAQAINSASSIKAAAASESISEKTAKLNAESDYIVAQQRLVKCEADPSSCK